MLSKKCIVSEWCFPIRESDDKVHHTDYWFHVKDNSSKALLNIVQSFGMFRFHGGLFVAIAML